VVEADAAESRRVTVAAVLLCTLLLGAVFAIDAITSGAAHAAVLYVPVVLVAALITTPRAVLFIAAAGVGLTVVGTFLFPEIEPASLGHVVGDQVVVCLAIAACGGFGAWMLRSRMQVQAAYRALLATHARTSQQSRLLEIAGDVGRFGGWSVDLAGGQLHWSREMAKLHGVDPTITPTLEEAMSFIAPEDRGRVQAAFAECVRRGTPFDVEMQLVRQDDGAIRWVSAMGRAERDATGTVTMVHGATQDITDRIEAQLDAEAHRRRLTSMTEAMPFVIWTASRDGSIDYLNEEFWRLTDVLAHDALGDAWLAVLHPDDRERSVDRWQRSVATGEPYSVEFRVRHARGGYRWHLTRAVPELDANGDAVRWWGTSLDIHDRRLLEQEANALADQLRQTLESIGDGLLALDRDWRITVVNSEAERLLGHSREQMLGHNLWMVFPDAVGTLFEDEYRRAVADQRPRTFAAVFDPLGIEFEVSAYPHDRGLTVYFRDISEHRNLLPSPVDATSNE
jgi:PAS domain S-box-containing protein